MTRLRNETTGAVVSVPEEKVSRLGPGWVEDKKARPAKKAAAKSDENS